MQIFCLHIISNTLQIFLVRKGGTSLSKAIKTLQFANLISAIWCILFVNIPKRRKIHHLDDSPFSDNLIDLWFNTWIKYKYSHISIFHLSPCFPRSFLSLLPLFLLFFQPPTPSFRVFHNLLTVLRGCFTPIGLIQLLLFSPFLSFFSSLFSFSSFLFLSSLLFLCYLSLPADFWCGDRRHAARLPTGLRAKIVRFLLGQAVHV